MAIQSSSYPPAPVQAGRARRFARASWARWRCRQHPALATISHDLKILVDAGIFTRDKWGVWAYYALVPSALNALSAVLSTTR